MAATNDMSTATPTELYLSLLKRCLMREIFADEQVSDAGRWKTADRLGPPDVVWPLLREQNLRIVANLELTDGVNVGKNWFPTADTMVGIDRMNNVQAIVQQVLDENVPGDLVETGVWRGGTVTLMKAILEANGDTERNVWVCDSFEGLPEPDVERYPADAEFATDDPFTMGWTKQVLSVSVEQVKATIERYGLLDDRVHFLKGWFKDTLPTAPIDTISVLRLDGDLYESTMDGLVNLESKVSPGGFVIVDDYGGLEACRSAVHDYRDEHGITDEIHIVDWTGAYWRKGG